MHAIIAKLYAIGAIQFGQFQLKNGQTSTVYINLRKIISYPELLQQIAQAMWQCLQHHSMDIICGVPYTALPIATCVSLTQNIPMVMRRKEKKAYGTKQSVEGVFRANATCVVLEDVITTGASILETVADLQTQQIIITDIVALIDREAGGKENLAKNYRVHTLFSLNQIMQELINSSLLTLPEKNLAQEFLLAQQTVC